MHLVFPRNEDRANYAIMRGNHIFMCLVWASSGGWVRVSDFKVVVKCKETGGRNPRAFLLLTIPKYVLLSHWAAC